MVVDIVMREVVLWDFEEECATELPSLFGIPEAVAAVIEEQGRGTLHIHLQIWIKEYNKWRADLWNSNSHVAGTAKRKIADFADKISSTQLFSRKRCRVNHGAYGAFPHPCNVQNDHHRQPPRVVEDQQLHDLRHKVGHQVRGGCYINCPHFTASWSSAEVASGVLSH